MTKMAGGDGLIKTEALWKKTVPAPQMQ